jgi:hypothetical protein
MINIRRIKSRSKKNAGQVVRMREMKNALKILLGNPPNNKPLGRPTLRWEENIKKGDTDREKLSKLTPDCVRR